ncbi:MAG: hypothetical protein ACRDV4_10000, partial [Acidimicrobiales bacterium]
LLGATNVTLDATITHYRLDYLPCSIFQPNTANRCANPEDANWTSPFGNWAWEGQLLGATVSGPGISLIDSTYSYGFGRLKGKLPPDTAGGFPDDYYSSAYNAVDGSAALASAHHRDQGILNYDFMITNSQSGPYSWWESSTAPSTDSAWVGRHPSAGQGSSPHAWGIAGANKVLLDSLVAQSSDGDLVVGRGVPSSWMGENGTISVTTFPTTDGHRISVRLSSSGRSVSMKVQGPLPQGRILLELPSFIDHVESTSSGHVDGNSGTVSLARGARRVTVELGKPQAAELRGASMRHEKPAAPVEPHWNLTGALS